MYKKQIKEEEAINIKVAGDSQRKLERHRKLIKA